MNIYDPRTMLQALEQMHPANTFLRNTFFGAERVFEADAVDIDLVKGKRRMAPFVAPNLPGVVVARDGYTTKSYKPPKINPKRVTTAEHAMKRLPGEVLYGSGVSPEDRAKAILAGDLVELDDMISRREEWMAAQALFTGQINVVGEGVNELVDFGHTLKETLSSGVKWNESGGDILGDLAGWRTQCIQKSGIAPDTCVMSSEVADVLMKNETLLKLLDNRRVELGQINTQQLPGGVTYIGYLGGRVSMDLYTYDEWYIDDAGNEQPMVPTGKVLVASPRARFERLYAVVDDVADDGTMLFSAVPRYPRTFVEKDPPKRFVQVVSRPLLVPVQVDSYFVGTVL